MAGPDRRSSTGIDRRASTRSSLPPQNQAINYDESDDDDNYDLQAMGISDGFRPSGAMTGHNRMSSGASQHITQGRRTPPPRPSSTTKPAALDSFALRHDGGMGMNVRRNSAATSNFNAAPTRSSSISTDAPYVRSESPYRGPSGPSHPYQMYPQESRLARTASIATTSTVQVPDRPYNGPGGPTHPYGMYPQNTVPEAEIETPPVAPVPVGFPGLNNNYQRRLGPDGEEIADIIGPDGHTEQLPPYTQYPDEAFARKTRPTVAIPLVAAGGIGLATRNPEFDSSESLNSPSRQSTRSAMSDASNHQVNMAAAGISEKKELKKWQQVARRKLCGIVPVWVLVLVVLVFIMFGIILGTVLAVLKPKHGPKHRVEPSGKTAESVVVTTMTTTFDATPLTASPTGLPDLPTGTYLLPISAPSAIQNSCLSNTEQSAAWTCQIPMTSYTIVVTPIVGAANVLADNEVRLGLGNSTFGQYYAYGTQPPVLSQDQVLNLVTDSQEPARGPAWFFEMPYNKVVILPEAALTAPEATAAAKKRNIVERGDARLGSDFKRKSVAQPGDKPWFCYWNGTLLEAFIYVNLTSSAGQSAAASSAPASATATTTSSYSSVATSQSTAYSASSLQFPPAYPKVLKIEERRVPGPQAIPPYCVQHVIDDYGAAQIATNSTNQPVIVYLNETEASTVSQMVARDPYYNVDGIVDRRQTTGASCGCAWLWT